MVDEGGDKPKEKDSWSKAVNTVANLVITTALVSMVFGFFATFGAIFALSVFK